MKRATKLDDPRGTTVARDSARTVFDHAQIGMAVLDSDGDLIHTNPAFRKLLGLEPDAPAGRSLDESGVRDHPARALGPFVAVAVTDTGSGIDAETKAHLFEPFFTTKKQGKGTGMGLASAFGIITQSGGFIEVASEFGRGSTFTLYLPSAGTAASRDDRAGDPARVTDRQT